MARPETEPHALSLPVEPRFHVVMSDEGVVELSESGRFYIPRLINEIHRLTRALLTGEPQRRRAEPGAEPQAPAEPGSPTSLHVAPSREELDERVALLRDIGQFPSALFSLILDGVREPLSWRQCLAAWETFRARAESGAARRDLGLYLHVPICTHKCTYCQIPVEILRSAADAERLVRAMEFELDQYAQVLGGYPVRALSVGGGTPNLLSEHQTRRLLAKAYGHFRRAPGFHMTVDLSPAAASPGKLKAWREFGASRVIFGVQTLDSGILRRVNRIGESEKAVVRALEQAHHIGFECIGVDLIAGLPGETVDGFLRTLERVVALRPHHIQVFRWVLEPKCEEYRLSGPLDAAALSERERILASSLEYMSSGPPGAQYTSQGAAYGAQFVRRDVDLFHMLAHYEMLRSAQSSILGVGLGAVSRIQGVAEYWTDVTWDEYLSWPDAPPERAFGSSPMSPGFPQSATWAAAMDEGLLSRREFREDFGVYPEEVFAAEIDYLTERGWLSRRGDIYSIPPGLGHDEAAAAGTIVFSLEDLRRARSRQRFLAEQGGETA